MSVAERLKELGIELPEAPAPAANYVPYVWTGPILRISGQIAKDGDRLITGKLGIDATIEEGQEAARICAINLLAQVNAAVEGDLDRLHRVVRLGGFVNSTPGFTDQPAVVNGASDLMVDIFGDKGRHTRTAVGCASLPFNVMVEIDGVFEFVEH